MSCIRQLYFLIWFLNAARTEFQTILVFLWCKIYLSESLLCLQTNVIMMLLMMGIVLHTICSFSKYLLFLSYDILQYMLINHPSDWWKLCRIVYKVCVSVKRRSGLTKRYHITHALTYPGQTQYIPIRYVKKICWFMTATVIILCIILCLYSSDVDFQMHIFKIRFTIFMLIFVTYGS